MISAKPLFMLNLLGNFSKDTKVGCVKELELIFKT